MEYTIWCDESVKHGELFSNFYGGVMVSSKNKEEIILKLEEKKRELNLYGEVKWTKITENYESKYTELIDLFFSFVAQEKLKIRIMFTDNAVVPVGLTKEQRENEFFKLYYQFIKHSFGLMTVTHPPETQLRIFFDNLPDTKDKCTEFKSFILGLNRFFSAHNIALRRENIAEIDSKKHVLLQCLDIVLGAMAFRLNRKHLQKPDGLRCRGKKTLAKERVYKHINEKIREICGFQFNIGCTTGCRGEVANRWRMPYRHWVFASSNSIRVNR